MCSLTFYIYFPVYPVVDGVSSSGSSGEVITAVEIKANVISQSASTVFTEV